MYTKIPFETCFETTMSVGKKTIAKKAWGSVDVDIPELSDSDVDTGARIVNRFYMYHDGSYWLPPQMLGLSNVVGLLFSKLPRLDTFAEELKRELWRFIVNPTDAPPRLPSIIAQQRRPRAFKHLDDSLNIESDETEVRRNNCRMRFENDVRLYRGVPFARIHPPRIIVSAASSTHMKAQLHPGLQVAADFNGIQAHLPLEREALISFPGFSTEEVHASQALDDLRRSEVFIAPDNVDYLRDSLIGICKAIVPETEVPRDEDGLAHFAETIAELKPSDISQSASFIFDHVLKTWEDRPIGLLPLISAP